MTRLWSTVSTGVRLVASIALALGSFVGIMHARDNLTLVCCIAMFAIACAAASDHLPKRES